MHHKDKITIYDYIASNVPSDAHFLINKFGKYRRARDKRELAYQLKDFVRTFGVNGLNELAKIHPDKKLLNSHCESCNTNKKLLAEEKYKLDNVERYLRFSNADGKGQKETKGEENTNKMLIMSGFILMGIALIVKK